MTDLGRKAHWENVYTTNCENEVSWFQQNPAPSLELIALASPTHHSPIVDIGAGPSRLVDNLVARGFQNVTVLDLSDAALYSAKTRLGEDGKNVRWVSADVTRWTPPQIFDIWHDRAAFHFLTEECDRAAYIARLERGVKIGGHAIMATFALDGPEKCSGLPVKRYDLQSLAQTLGSAFQIIEAGRHVHATPWKSNQSFLFALFRRLA